MPSRVRGLRHISRARVRLGMGVAVDHAVDLEAPVVGVVLGVEMVLRVDRVHPGRGGSVGAAGGWLVAGDGARACRARPAAACRRHCP